ncbi:MAG: YbhB/YbcL family Raf kinase inhibitor-like protein [Armatimonadota bacterium]
MNKVSAPMNLTVSSASSKSGATIPLVHSDYGDRKSPQLAWSGVPSGTKSIVVLCEDPDSFSPKPYAHWLVANIPATMTSLPLDVSRTPAPSALGGGIQGTGYAGVLGYFGPKPPTKDPAHAYHFQVMALDTNLDLKPGFTRAELTDKVKGHVIGKGEIVGMFKKEG